MSYSLPKVVGDSVYGISRQYILIYKALRFHLEKAHLGLRRWCLSWKAIYTQSFELNIECKSIHCVQNYTLNVKLHTE